MDTLYGRRVVITRGRYRYKIGIVIRQSDRGVDYWAIQLHNVKPLITYHISDFQLAEEYEWCC